MIIYLKNRLRDYWVFIIAALFIVVSRGEVPAVKMVILIMVEFFCILIPGEIFLRFTKITFKNGAAAHLCAYAAGYVMSILLYIVVLMIGIQKYCLPVYLIYGGAGAIFRTSL